MVGTNLFELARALPPWALLGFGVVTGGLRSMWTFLYEHTIGYAMTRISLSLTVEDVEHREAYLWLSHWVESHLCRRRINSLLLRKPESNDNDSPAGTAQIRLIPEYGTYYLTYKSRLMVIDHRKETQGSGHRAVPMHSMRLQMWLAWDRSVMLEILQEAKAAYDADQAAVVPYFRASLYNGWVEDSISPRPLSSVYHPRALLDDLFTDVKTFLASKAIYHELGIPYRRGYQLAGPPGSGKSTLILTVASEFRLPIYAVPLRSAEMSGERLSGLLITCRRPSLIVLEDIDCLKVAMARDSQSESGLSTADLLNAIDGIGATEDRLLFMTTNHPDRLHQALTRAGRVDRKFYIGYACDEELLRFYQRVAAHQPMLPWPDFRAALPRKATIADAQAYAFQTAE